MTDSVCVIGARAGSKRLPGKNKLLLGGVPLYERAIGSALAAGVFDRIVFTTDDEEILADLERFPVLAHHRDASLAGDDVVFTHVLEAILTNPDLGGNESCACVLTPCHPFRNAGHIRKAHDLFQRSEAASLMSLTPSPCPPSLHLRIKDGLVRGLPSGRLQKGVCDASYYPDGALIFVRRDRFLKEKKFYMRETAGFPITWPESLDIDTPEDYALAQRLAPAFLEDA